MIYMPILGLGFLSGMQHALEADHVAAVSSIAARGTVGPPPMKWSDSKYGFAIEEDCNGEEETQARRDRCEVAAG